MKKLAVILCLSAFATGAFAQGLVNFLNSASTLISSDGAAIPAGQPGAYYFALLSAPRDSTDAHIFTSVGVGGTNQNVMGRINGGTGRVANGWAAGETRAFLIVGWSLAGNGSAFDPAWMGPGNVVTPMGSFLGCPNGWFGVSSIAPAGVAGGGPQALPNLNVFGGTQGLQTGFNLVPVPEPTSMALAGLGAAALLIFRRRK